MIILNTNPHGYFELEKVKKIKALFFEIMASRRIMLERHGRDKEGVDDDKMALISQHLLLQKIISGLE